MKLVFATNNRHKLEEISAIIGDKIEILGLNDIGCHDDIPETADTFEGNALLKARYVKDKYEYDCSFSAPLAGPDSGRYLETHHAAGTLRYGPASGGVERGAGCIFGPLCG